MGMREQESAVAELLSGTAAPAGGEPAPSGRAQRAAAAAEPDDDIDPENPDADPDPAPAGGEADEDKPAPEPGAEDPDAEAPFTLKELAAKLEVPAKSLYELAIPLADGKTASIGELKDAYIGALETKTELERVTTHWEARENEIMVARRQLGQVAAMMGERLPANAGQMIAELDEQTQARERAALLQAIPEWANPAAVQADVTAMLAFVKEYGFNRLEFGAMVDHRLIKMVRDFAKIRAKGRELAAKPRPEPVQLAAPGSRAVSGKAASLRAAITRAKAPGAKPADKLAAINQLLG